jgi:hypothetical protein
VAQGGCNSAGACRVVQPEGLDDRESGGGAGGGSHATQRPGRGVGRVAHVAQSGEPQIAQRRLVIAVDPQVQAGGTWVSIGPWYS